MKSSLLAVSIPEKSVGNTVCIVLQIAFTFKRKIHHAVKIHLN